MNYLRNKLNALEDVKKIVENLTFDEILELSNAVRVKNFHNKVELCSIQNVKSGKCSEDCVYCAQSARYDTDIEEYDFISPEKVIKEALKYDKAGVKRFSLVTSGKKLSDLDFSKIISLCREIKSKTKLSLCVSSGFLSKEQLIELKNSGVTKYHHNLETGPRFFDKICTTHSFKDKADTIEKCNQLGLQVCSGGIFGLGESLDDRIEMALELKRLKVKSIPINILKPIRGTPLENMRRLSNEEILLSIAIFRIINPKATIIIAAGRPFLSENENLTLLKSGINGFMVGDYLTTGGVSLESDLDFFKRNNLFF